MLLSSSKIISLEDLENIINAKVSCFVGYKTSSSNIYG